MDNEATYRCRVCGLKQSEPPWGVDGTSPTYDFCPCCGVEFGYGDASLAGIRAARERWLSRGGQWHDPKQKPAEWNMEEQLRQIPSAYV